LLLANVAPTVIAAGRYAAYGLVSLVGLALLGGLRQPLAVWGQALFLSCIGMVLYFVALSAALHQAGVVVPTLIIGMLPITIPLAACALSRTAPSGAQCLGFGLTLIGNWLARPEGPSGSGSGLFWGTLLALFSLLIWTLYALLNAHCLRRQGGALSAQQWSAMQGVACLPFVLPLLAIGGGLPTGDALTRWLCISLVLGVVCSWWANGLWNAASTRLSHAQIGPLIVVETLAGLTYGRLWSGQPWLWSVWLGAGLLVLGVVLAEVAGRKPPAAKAEA
jgi:drug/metabolite transporter (DMT)-like permease